jgi:uncharacterized damage-inducible protein DinB
MSQAAGDPLVRHWSRLFALNADLLLNAVEDLTADQAMRAVVADGNTIAFVVAHLIDTRHFLVKLLGRPLDNPVERALAGARSQAEVGELPPLPGLRVAWVAISRHLERTLERLDRAALDAACDPRFPGGDGSVEGTIGFLLQHDSYHLGQIALLRRQWGLPAMAYRRGALAAIEAGVE